MDENMDVRTSIAYHKDAVHVVEAARLATKEGVPLVMKKGDNQALVLFTQPTCTHHGQWSREIPTDYSHSKIQPMFDTAEHMITIAGCNLTLPNGNTSSALTMELPVGPNLKLTYGQVIALGGDFYGDPNQPVCTAGNQQAQINQFQKNFNSLQSSATEVQKILSTANKYEFVPIAARVRNHQNPSGVYASIPWTKGWVMNDEDEDFDENTGGGGPHTTTFGRYSKLALSNLDHFGVDAIACYTAGHILAQQQAQKAHNSNDPQGGLLLAYAINAFADHFLTDLFSAGHMRTPRRQMYFYKSTIGPGINATLSGACAKAMHDEDSKFGLWVDNAMEDRWVAYGDARYRDICNAANRAIMKKALQQSMNDVWNAFNTGTITGQNSKVFRYLPSVITAITQPGSSQGQRDDTRNWAPLFWCNPNDGYIYQRDSLSDISVRTYSWKTVAGLASTAGFIIGEQQAGLWKSYMPQQEYVAAGYPYPPNETGPSGEVGWPPSPTQQHGYPRVWGATGPDLWNFQLSDWRVDGATGPTGLG